MKTITSLTLGLALAATMYSQPGQWPVAIDLSDETTLPENKRVFALYRFYGDITVDGVKDSIWIRTGSTSFDRYIKYQTIKINDTIKSESLLSDGLNIARLPDNAADFSGDFKILHNNDFVYLYFDITDDEVNDGTVNPINEEIRIFEAPYSDSVQQALNGNAYPPYTGSAPEINKKYAYWNYLGANQFYATIKAEGSCEVSIAQKADAIQKINYEQRGKSCGCAWKKTEFGYQVEISLSRKIAMADSAGNPFSFFDKNISFDCQVKDMDLNKKNIIAAWNSENANVSDAMLYAGRLFEYILCSYPMKCNEPWDIKKENDMISFYPNPASDLITFSELFKNAEIISIQGEVVKTAQNTNQIIVSDLPAGFYFVKADGAVGKLIKE